MDLKILKQELSVNNEFFNQSAEQSIELDITVPEYYPEIDRVLKCRATPRVSSAGINGQILSVEGNVNIVLMYITPKNELCSYEYILPFNRTFEFEGDTIGCMPICTVREEYMNCRPLDSRSVEIHGAVGINAKIIKKQCTQIVTDFDGGGVVLNRGTAPATTPIGMAEKCVGIEEELELGNGQPSVKHILRYDAKPVNLECKIISGKVVAKGEVRVTVLYCGEQTAAPQTFRTKVPYSTIIEIDGINDECECETNCDLACLEIKARTSITGEARTFSMSGKLRFRATACCNNEVPVVYDAFSTKYETDVMSKEIMVEKIFKTVNESFVCKRNIEINSGTVGTVIDIWGEPQVTACRVDDNELYVIGVMPVFMLAYDSDSNPIYIERSIDFDCKFAVGGASHKMRGNTAVSLKNISYTIIDNCNIEICAEIMVNSSLYNISKIKVVNDIVVSQDILKKSQKNCAMIVYYADKGEQVWDIARKFNSSPNEISEINSVDIGEIKCAKPLLIPIK